MCSGCLEERGKKGCPGTLREVMSGPLVVPYKLRHRLLQYAGQGQGEGPEARRGAGRLACLFEKNVLLPIQYGPVNWKSALGAPWHTYLEEN